MRQAAPALEILNRMTGRAVDLGRRLPGEVDLVTAILTRLPQVSGHLSRGGATAAAELMELLIRDINGLIVRHPDHAEFVTAMMGDINELGRVADIWGPAESRSGRRRDEDAEPKRRRRSGEGVEYFRRTGRGEDVLLVESRPGTTRDFHVHESDHRRAIEAVTSTADKDWVKFGDIFDAYERLAEGEKVSVYPLRVLLRYWRRLSPPLVARRHARYRITGSATHFRRGAKRAWDQCPMR